MRDIGEDVARLTFTKKTFSKQLNIVGRGQVAFTCRAGARGREPCFQWPLLLSDSWADVRMLMCM